MIMNLRKIRYRNKKLKRQGKISDSRIRRYKRHQKLLDFIEFIEAVGRL